MPPGQRAHHFSARDQVTHNRVPLAHPGAKDLHQPHCGNRPLAPSAGSTRRRIRRQTGGRPKSETLKQPCGRRTGGGVFGAWQMQGLIAGASLRPDPGTGSGDAGGNNGTGLGHSLLILPGSPWVSRASGRVLSPGQLWASLGLPGHLRGISPANGTCPVGLRGATTHQVPLSPVPGPLAQFCCLVGTRPPECSQRLWAVTG